MSRVTKFWMLIISTMLYVGCSEIQDELEVFNDDVEFDTNERTTDVRMSRAEDMALAYAQGVLRPHVYSPVFDFLDASQLPDDAVDIGDGEYQRTCSNGGTATYTYSRAAGEHHGSGDRASVRYDNCLGDNGYVFDGLVTFKYEDIEGWNLKLVPVDSAYCISRIQSNKGGIQFVENIDDEGEYYEADDVRFVPYEDHLRVDFLKEITATSEADYEILDSHFVEKEAVVAFRALVKDEDRSTPDIDRFKLDDSVYPSLTGDRIYLAEGDSQDWNEARCQDYSREVDANLQSLSLTDPEGVHYLFNGKQTLQESVENFENRVQRVRNGEYDVITTQANIVNKFEMQGLEAYRFVNKDGTTYAFDVLGQIKSDAFFGTVEVDMTQATRGLFADDYPIQGFVLIQGRGLERVNVVYAGLDIELRVDYDGFDKGDGASVHDDVIFTTWYDLLDRKFKF